MFARVGLQERMDFHFLAASGAARLSSGGKRGTTNMHHINIFGTKFSANQLIGNLNCEIKLKGRL